MITKYGMSREAMHYGHIIESSLPLITDSKLFEPLESDLGKAAEMFKSRMGRFMQKRHRNKDILMFVFLHKLRCSKITIPVRK